MSEAIVTVYGPAKNTNKCRARCAFLEAQWLVDLKTLKLSHPDGTEQLLFLNDEALEAILDCFKGWAKGARS